MPSSKPPDTSAPSAPGALTASVASSTQVNLSWAASTDNVAVTGYQVERCQGAGCANFARIATPSITSYGDAGLTSGNSYSYRVRATDAAGNVSGYSPTSAAVIPDTTPPSAPGNPVATVASNTQINLTWTASTDNVAVTGYLVERCQGTGCSNFAQIASQAGTSLNDTGLAPSTSYSYRVRATDAANNVSSFSSTATAVTSGTADTTPPSTPTNVVATAASSVQIHLSWTASTDNVGVSYYSVERCQGTSCSSFAQVSTPITTALNDTGLTPSTSYSYRIRAVDAANNFSNYSAIASATTSAIGAVSVAISPVRGGLAMSQSQLFTATVQNDGGAGVAWSTSAGSFSAQTSTTATFVAPSTAGTVTVTATSLADNTKKASATIGVSDLAGVTTYHNSLARDGVNSHEYALTPTNVQTATFGKLFSCTADGAIYGQPLWVPGVTIGGVKHNVVFVATQHDSLYAFDADTSPCLQLWHVSLIDTLHGGLGGETSVPSGGAGAIVGSGFGDITPEVGILGTPVIDLTTSTVYAVSKSTDSTKTTVFQRLHAIDIATGNEKLSGPVAISASVSGDGDGSVGGIVSFDPKNENQRAGLALVNGVVYICWASHEDHDPYHGWVIGYRASDLTRVAVFNTTPSKVSGFLTYSRGGIWMGGGAPAADTNNDLYLITGNGAYDGISAFGDSVLRLTPSAVAPGLTVADWFAPHDQLNLDATDADFGSGGTVVLVDLPPPAPVPHLLVAGGKQGTLFLLNRSNLGHFNALNDSAAVQSFPASGEILATPAFWQNKLYYAAEFDTLKAFTLDPLTGLFVPAGASMQSAHSFNPPGATPSVSWNGTNSGIVWALDNSAYCTTQTTAGCGPAVLYAFDATNLAELWNSTGAGDTAGFAVKFTVPTVANGKVYVGTRGNDNGAGTSSIRGELDVYGLKPN